MEITLNTEQLAELLDKTADEVADAFKEGETGDNFSNLLNERLKAVASDVRNEQYNRAKKEVLSEKEKQIAESYGLEPKKMDDLISEIVKAKESELTSKLDNTDQIATLEQKFQGSIEEKENLINELQEKLSEQEKQFERSNLQREVAQRLPNLLKENNFVIPDGKPGENVLRQITNELVNNARLTDQGIQVVDEEGNPLKQDFKAVTFDNFAAKQAENWLLKAQSDGRKGTGSTTQKPGQGNGTSFKFEKKDPALLTQKLREARETYKDDFNKMKAVMGEIKEAYEAADA